MDCRNQSLGSPLGCDTGRGPSPLKNRSIGPMRRLDLSQTCGDGRAVPPHRASVVATMHGAARHAATEAEATNTGVMRVVRWACFTLWQVPRHLLVWPDFAVWM